MLDVMLRVKLEVMLEAILTAFILRNYKANYKMKIDLTMGDVADRLEEIRASAKCLEWSIRGANEDADENTMDDLAHAAMKNFDLVKKLADELGAQLKSGGAQ